MEQKLEESVREKVESYVYNKYRDYKDKELIIEDVGNMFKIRKHINAGPLFLGKSILEA